MITKELRILFSEQNPEQQAGIKNYFDSKGIKTYFCARDGREVLKEIERIAPQVVVLDIFLSSLDAIGVKRACDGKNFSPKLFFAVGSCDNERISNQLIDAGYDYYMLKPYAFEVVEDRITELLGAAFGRKVPEHDLEYRVSEILHTMGVPAHVKGYNFLRQSIIMVIKDPEVISLVTKRLYPDIAKLNGTTASRVERAIRHAIEIAWDRGNVEIMNEYFGYTINNMRGKPTNSEFIAMISDRMRLALKKEKIAL